MSGFLVLRTDAGGLHSWTAHGEEDVDAMLAEVRASLNTVGVRSVKICAR